MIAVLLACGVGGTDPERVYLTAASPEPPEDLARIDRFAEHAPGARDVILVVDPAIARSPGLHDLVDVVLEHADVRLAVASMVAGSVPEWSARVDWPRLAAESGPLAAYDVAMSATGFSPDASVQVVLATAGGRDRSRATVDELAIWIDSDAFPLASAAHVVGPCGGQAGSLEDAAEATGGRIAEVCDHPTPVADGILVTEWGYALSDRPHPGTLSVVDEGLWVEAGFQEYDPISGYGDFVYDPASNAVSFLDYQPTGVVAITYRTLRD